VTISPALAPSAHVVSATLDGKSSPVRIVVNSLDQHATVRVPVGCGTRRTLSIQVADDFGLEYVSSLPALGSRSEGLRFIGESWSTSQVRLLIAGRPGQEYLIKMNSDASIGWVENGSAVTNGRERFLRVSFPPVAADEYQLKTVVVHFQQADAYTPTAHRQTARPGRERTGRAVPN
jgi:hypothetical protein